MNTKITIKDIRTIIQQTYTIEIYTNNELFIRDKTTGTYCFNRNKNNTYIVKVYSKNEVRVGVIKNNNTLEIIFGNCLLTKNNNITLILTDYYYKDLRIERGNINLWPNRTQ